MIMFVILGMLIGGAGVVYAQTRLKDERKAVIRIVRERLINALVQDKAAQDALHDRLSLIEYDLCGSSEKQ